MKKSKDTRFVIAGAGAAGLSAAEALKEKGYSDIIILEKESFAGGKCRSAFYDGRTYELGAGIIAANNRCILNLLRKYDIPLSRIIFEKNNLYDLIDGNLGVDVFSLPEKFSFYWQLVLRYNRLLRQYPEVKKPGLSICEPELFDNFHHWADIHGLELVEKNLAQYFTGFGYGYWEKIPAAYTLKYNDWDSLVSYFRQAIYCFPDGIQGLWIKVAEAHRVIYNSPLRSVDRKDNVIRIVTPGKQLEADVLLLTCPLDESLNFLDADSIEQELFSKIKYTDYRTYVCRLEDFPNQTGFIPAHFQASKKGYPVFWYKRYADTNIYTIYVLSDFSVSDEMIEKNVKETVQQLGGTLVKIEEVLKWKYFPHVDTADMQNGYYKRLEAQQGIRNTYYSGELLNFSTVELTAAYSRDLVDRFF
jgi:predicted NAD/FAD-dependent oxidoreductase